MRNDGSGPAYRRHRERYIETPTDMEGLYVEWIDPFDLDVRVACRRGVLVTETASYIGRKVGTFPAGSKHPHPVIEFLDRDDIRPEGITIRFQAIGSDFQFDVDLLVAESGGFIVSRAFETTGISGDEFGMHPEVRDKRRSPLVARPGEFRVTIDQLRTALAYKGKDFPTLIAHGLREELVVQVEARGEGRRKHWFVTPTVKGREAFKQATKQKVKRKRPKPPG